MARFLISCGGTGGHLSPGIALAEGLAVRGHVATLLISRKKIDARLAEKYPHLKFERLPGSGFGWRPVTLARCVTSQVHAFSRCVRLLRQQPVDAVIGLGGFTSAPLVAAARFSGVPAVLHEANRIPGLAVRTLGRFARRVYLPPGVTLRGIHPGAIRHAGLPVRAEIRRQPATTARAALGLDPDRPVLLVLGGSQGASPLNEWTRTNVAALAEAGIQVYCVTGPGKGQEGPVELRSAAGTPVRAVFESFSDRVALLMSAADLAVSRAGAGTISELIRCETPAILVPFPQAADDHQRANALYLEQQGGCVVVPQTRLNELYERTTALLANPASLQAMRENLRSLDRVNPLELILDDLDTIAGRGASGRTANVALA
ncbi:MAG TPA: UDP-N-acetylglucosamine--N-acetylmuramyl-(pentapeptide) pyrophosphoryl-undecaprenol N-acetylglucosamine transferase [Opitutaceae bacterium]|nr:UDP-N-acetylglucosamine--N-acetylmuramyl-(pentapeptide) pyrophosphoryl-undecaprenol N-acetylglucosamine transferase [Opitutaceae bacterium]